MTEFALARPARRRRGARGDFREVARGWSLVAPLYLFVTAVIVIPEIWALYLSFTDYSVGRTPQFVGLANYRATLSAAEFWMAAWRTLLFVTIAVSLEVVIGLWLACILARLRAFRGIIIACLIAPIAMSHAVTATMWGYLLDLNVGPINFLTEMMGLGRLPWLSSEALALPTVAFIEFWAGMPHVLIMLFPVRAALSPDIYEAADLDRATALQSFWRITLPLLMPALLIAMIFRIIITMRAFGTVWILTKGGPLESSELLSIYLYKTGFSYWNFGQAAAIAWLMLLLTAAASSLYMLRLYRDAAGNTA
ncbi:MAG: sugar ABC transporter permease [Chelatococcus sp.]|uniref:carbohydrate ABC transporter permease n=1 Tax=Chelatococcus sp. TaxID=1953771 RepID=UPI0025BAD65F|nr:sugar ABC transporter permease [Chelatococcus sp.]MBX3540805.1 sugar ABC transporter permease [Chelatococcus sp.]